MNYSPARAHNKVTDAAPPLVTLAIYTSAVAGKTISSGNMKQNISDFDDPDPQGMCFEDEDIIDEYGCSNDNLECPTPVSAVDPVGRSINTDNALTYVILVEGISDDSHTARGSTDPVDKGLENVKLVSYTHPTLPNNSSV
mgnify:CR=1 FL=1